MTTTATGTTINNKGSKRNGGGGGRNSGHGGGNFSGSGVVVAALPGQSLQQPSLPSFHRHRYLFCCRRMNAMVKVHPA
jgi:hypothetical protein